MDGFESCPSRTTVFDDILNGIDVDSCTDCVPLCHSRSSCSSNVVPAGQFAGISQILCEYLNQEGVRNLLTPFPNRS